MNYGTYFSFYSSFILIIPLMHAALVALLLLRLRFQDLVARKTKGKKKKEKRKEKKEWVSILLSFTEVNILALWSKQLRKKTQFIDIRKIGTLSKFQAFICSSFWFFKKYYAYIFLVIQKDFIKKKTRQYKSGRPNNLILSQGYIEQKHSTKKQETK